MSDTGSICWKVTDQHMGSAIVEGPWALSYLPHVPIKAWPDAAREGYHPVAFASLKDAQVYANCWRDTRVWEARGYSRKPLPPVRHPTRPHCRMLRGESIDDWMKWPDSTVMFERIALLKEVDGSEHGTRGQ